MKGFRSGLPPRYLKRVHWILFALLGVPACVLLMARMIYIPSGRLVDAEDVEEVFQQIAAGQPLEGRPQALWAEIGPAAVALKRLAAHVTDQVENGVRNPDKVYLEGQADVIAQFVARDARTALYFLAHVCLRGEIDMERILALVILRELFPKKNSVYYYSNHLSLDSNATIALLARDIIAGSFPRGSLGDKLTDGYFSALAERARVNGSVIQAAR